MASRFTSKHSKMILWIPSGMDANDKTLEIANTMKTKFKMTEIDKDDYNDNFQRFYEKNMKGHNDDVNGESFCKAKGKTGVNMGYLIDNANKSTFITLMAVNKDHFSDDYLEVNAILIFRWTKTADSLKIQVLCGDQRKKGTGDGTRLLNIVKKTLTDMGLNNIYLNPIDVAVPYYHKQNFKNTTNSDKIIHDSSDPKPKTPSKSRSKTKSKSKTKSRSKSRSRSKSKSKGKTPSPIYSSPKSHHASAKLKTPKEVVIPSMTMNLRARSNWNKTKSKFKAMSVLKENINKSKSKRPSPYKLTSIHHLPQDSEKTTREKKLLLKIDEIIENISEDERDIANFDDIELLIGKEVQNYKQDKDQELVRKYISKKYDIK